MASPLLAFLSDRKRPFLLPLSFFLVASSILLILLLLRPDHPNLAFFSSISTTSSPSPPPPPIQNSNPNPTNWSPAETRGDGNVDRNNGDGSGGGESGGANPPPLQSTNPNTTNSSQPDTHGDGNVDSNIGDRSDGGDADPPRLQYPNPTNSSQPKTHGDGIGNGSDGDDGFEFRWEVCRVRKGVSATDYIPCLDNVKAVKALKSRRHMEHRERHCPPPAQLRCLVPLPVGYRVPVPWPRSRYMIWYDNVPHPKLVEYKKDQNWVKKSDAYLVFPGGGTQFKAGVTRYIRFIEKIMPAIEWGKHTRIVLDVGCGVASFGGYLLDKNVITMSFAPKDEHEAQIQFALERGIPAFLAVIGTQKLPFPDNVFDVIHCARCRVHWYADGGKPLLELNRVLRPGGYFIWSATPVYRHDKRHEDLWNAMVTVTESICWKTVVKSRDANGIGVVVYQKPTSNSCYSQRKFSDPPLCTERDGSRMPWYSLLDSCLPVQPVSGEGNDWPVPWPERLNTRYSSRPNNSNVHLSDDKFNADTKYWRELVSEVYRNDFAVNWSSIRNVMDMNAGFGGFAAALINQPLWVMNVVPFGQPDTLTVIFDRGLIGVYHDWCESFNTYPRTYDLLHMSHLLGSLTYRCDIIALAAEIDRILRPGRWFVLQDSMEMIKKIRPILRSLHYETTIVKEQFLVATKGFWRPG